MRRTFAPWLVAATLAVSGCTVAPPDGPSSGPVTPSDDDATSSAPRPSADEQPDVPPLHPEVDGWDASVVTIVSDDETPIRVDVRVAATPSQRQRGLMEVPDLPGGSGMLFVFDDERTGGFWMKDTLVPLDIAFAAPDGRIRAILTMEPCGEDPCPTYDPEVAYDRALEVPAGWFAMHGVSTGDRLEVGPIVADEPPGEAGGVSGEPRRAEDAGSDGSSRARADARAS